MNEVIKVTEIRIEVGYDIDLLTIFNETNYDGFIVQKWRQFKEGKGFDCRKLLLVCTSQYSERPIMNIENMSKGRE